MRVHFSHRQMPDLSDSLICFVRWSSMALFTCMYQSIAYRTSERLIIHQSPESSQRGLTSNTVLFESSLWICVRNSFNRIWKLVLLSITWVESSSLPFGEAGTIISVHIVILLMASSVVAYRCVKFDFNMLPFVYMKKATSPRSNCRRVTTFPKSVAITT